MADRHSPVTAYIGLGSNLGDKRKNIRRALELLGGVPGVRVRRVAPLYRTAPVGYTEQDWFINTVAEVETSLPPEELLRVCLDIENRLGRVRIIRWGPRTVDLDLLLYGERAIDRPQLTVPHPRLHERAFVLVPLADLVPEMVVPGRGRVKGLLAGLPPEQRETVERMVD